MDILTKIFLLLLLFPAPYTIGRLILNEGWENDYNDNSLGDHVCYWLAGGVAEFVLTILIFAAALIITA